MELPATLGAAARWIRTFIYPLKDDAGLRQIIVMHEDVTEKKRIEDALRLAAAAVSPAGNGCFFDQLVLKRGIAIDGCVDGCMQVHDFLDAAYVVPEPVHKCRILMEQCSKGLHVVVVPGGLKRVGRVFGLSHLNHVGFHKRRQEAPNVCFGAYFGRLGQILPHHGMFAHGRPAKPT